MTGLFEFSSTNEAIKILFIIVIVLFVLLAAVIVCGILFYKKKISKINSLINRNPSGKMSATAYERLQDVEEQIIDLTDNIDDLYRRMHKTYQRVGVAKYSAYSGGNVSFVLAMLDESDSGFILNVINGREGSNMYLKEVIGGTCTERLGAEEAHALEIALESGEI